MMELCLATVTSPAPQGPLVIRLEDSVPAGSMSSVDSAQNVLRDTMASPTADVSEWFLVLVRVCKFPTLWPLLELGWNAFVQMKSPLSLLQRVSVAADCVMRWQDAASALLRQSNQPVMCVSLRLSAIILCWAARAANVLLMASKPMQGPTVTASLGNAGKWKPYYLQGCAHIKNGC